MPQLELHMRATLNTGVTAEGPLEIVIQMAAYAGYLQTCMNDLTLYRTPMAAIGHTLPGLNEEK